MTLKQDLLNSICYLIGHKPTRILQAGFPFGLGIHTLCKRCGKTMNWKKVLDMLPKEASELYRELLEEKIDFHNNTQTDSAEVLFATLEKLKQMAGLSDGHPESLGNLD